MRAILTRVRVAFAAAWARAGVGLAAARARIGAAMTAAWTWISGTAGPAVWAWLRGTAGPAIWRAIVFASRQVFLRFVPWLLHLLFVRLTTWIWHNLMVAPWRALGAFGRYALVTTWLCVGAWFEIRFTGQGEAFLGLAHLVVLTGGAHVLGLEAWRRIADWLKPKGKSKKKRR